MDAGNKKKKYYILKSYCETDTHLSDLFELFFKAPTIVLL